MSGLRARLLIVGLGLGLLGTRPGVPPRHPASTPRAVARAARSTAAQQTTARAMVIDVLATHPHDRGAYTQGLVWEAGTLWESTGLIGESSLRRVDLATGAVLQRRDIGGEHFAEGLARVGDRLIQLTWRSDTAFIWDKTTFEPAGEFSYNSEGWGLCHDGTHLVMSDGSDTLYVRDPETFALIEMLPVTLNGRPLAALNELECVGDSIYANVWTQTYIVRIDRRSGAVTERIDAADLDAAIRARHHFTDAYDCLNGIAYVPETERFLLTGKHWPELYEVRFRAAGEPPATASPTATATATPTAGGVVYLPWGTRTRR